MCAAGELPEDRDRDGLLRVILSLVENYHACRQAVEDELAAAAEGLAAPPEYDPPDPEGYAPGPQPRNWWAAVYRVWRLLLDQKLGPLPGVKLAAGPAEPAEAVAWQLFGLRASDTAVEALAARLLADPALQRDAAAAFGPGGAVGGVILAEWVAARGPGFHDRLAAIAATAGLDVAEVVGRCGLTGAEADRVLPAVAEWADARRQADRWKAAGLSGVGRALPRPDPPAVPAVPPAARTRLTDSDRNILTALAEADGPLTSSEVAGRAGNSPNTVRKRMGDLQRRGLVVSAGGYRITPDGRAAVG